jgi:phage host-nuclease inhibitor protein Gam
MAKAKVKSKAEINVPQSKDECAAYIKKLGGLLRQKTRDEADMNDEIANITQRWQPELEILQTEIDQLQKGIQAYCEAHRDELTNGGKTKSANLITGDVMWRQKPPSVRIKAADAVIEALKRLGLGRFVRTKDEVNKEAILNEPDAVRGVAGISFVTGEEQFEISPFEQEAG